MRIVIDTNVIASALFYGGKPYHLLRYIMEEQVDVVASKEIVDEYEEIVHRLKQKYPAFSTRIPLHELLTRLFLNSFIFERFQKIFQSSQKYPTGTVPLGYFAVLSLSS